MPVTYSTPPAPGTAKPSNLYADLQSRSLWLGVDPAVEPAGAVLISDILALQEEIAEGDLEQKAYTDAQILTRAPASHTHTASQITNFTSAVQAVVNAMPSASWQAGMILMFHGSLAEIGVGPYAGWQLCDGSNGTPDLRDKFVLGAGNKAPGVVNPMGIATTNIKGAHTHTVQGHALTEAQMPAHAHPFSVRVAGSTGTESADHTHNYTVRGAHISVQGGTSNFNIWDEDGVASTTGRSAAHTHFLDVTPSGTTESKGGGQSHTHTLGTTGDHDHTINSAALRDAIPYYAMAFIMRL